MKGGLVPRGPDRIVRKSAELPTSVLSPAEYVTQQFYQWEVRGRGWQTWEYPVVLEPPFRPFLFHNPNPIPVEDDGRKSHLLIRAAQALGKLIIGRKLIPEIVGDIEPEPDPLPLDSTDLSTIQIHLPVDLKVGKEAAAQFLTNLSHCSYPTALEAIGTRDKLVLQLACRPDDAPTVRQQLHAYFPEVALSEGHDFLKEAWDETERCAIINFGLSHEFMLPLKTLKSFDPDPWSGFIASLSHLNEKEVGVLQILFQRVVFPWTESIIRAVSDGEGESFFADAPDTLALAKEKIGHPLYAVVIRVGGQADTDERALRLLRDIGSGLAHFANPSSNELIPLNNDDYYERDQELDLLGRLSHRSGMILNSEELVSLVHLPSASVRSAKLRQAEKIPVKAPPRIASGHELLLGETPQEGATIQVSLSPEQRTKHMYVIGASGTGKSTLLLNLILQDIQQGRGVGILDPHGDLIDQIVSRIPQKRANDVILFDPSDSEYPIGFNILSAHTEAEKNLLASDLVAIFRRLSTSWGDQMNSVLANAILAFLESSEGGTLLDLRRFLLDKDFRQSFLATIHDPEVVYYWQKEFPLLTGTKSLAPLLTRLDTFTRPKVIRYLITQKENRLDFGRAMNEGKIVLAKLAQGAIGEENAYLLGSLLVTKFQQSALSRQSIPESKRRPFFLYLDEFHQFLTPSLVALLSGGRKFGIGLVLAHQEIRQLVNEDTSVASAVLANPYTRICFRLGDFDAKKLEDGFSSFTAKDLQNLGVGQAICRVERAEYDFTMNTLPFPTMELEEAERNRVRITELSRKQNATPRALVEAEIQKQYTMPPPVEGPLPAPSKPTNEPIEEKVSPAPKKLQVEKLKPVRRPAEPKPLGRGGETHKYLQSLIKRYGENKGYHGTIEKPVEGGMVDVALERAGHPPIACEISVTTDPEHELGNLEKCLRAGFEKVLLISTERKTLDRIKGLATGRLSEVQMSRIWFLTPEDYFFFLEELSAQSAQGQATIKGYTVNTVFRPLNDQEKEDKKKRIVETIWNSIRKIEK